MQARPSYHNWKRYEDYLLSQIDKREAEGISNEPEPVEENETGRVWSF